MEKAVLASLNTKFNVGIAVKDTFILRKTMFMSALFFLFTVAANIDFV